MFTNFTDFYWLLICVGVSDGFPGCRLITGDSYSRYLEAMYDVDTSYLSQPNLAQFEHYFARLRVDLIIK